MSNHVQSALRAAIRAIEALKVVDQSQQSCAILSRGSTEWMKAHNDIETNRLLAAGYEVQARAAATAIARVQRERRRGRTPSPATVSVRG